MIGKKFMGIIALYPRHAGVALWSSICQWFGNANKITVHICESITPTDTYANHFVDFMERPFLRYLHINEVFHLMPGQVVCRRESLDSSAPDSLYYNHITHLHVYCDGDTYDYFFRSILE